LCWGRLTGELMSWDESWAERAASNERSAAAINEFWKAFIDELMEVVTEDGVVDYGDPENIEAWVGPPWVTLQLDSEKQTITARFWTQKKDLATVHLFDRTLKIEEGRADLGEFGVPSLESAARCGAVIGKFLFDLRTQEAE